MNWFKKLILSLNPKQALVDHIAVLERENSVLARQNIILKNCINSISDMNSDVNRVFHAKTTLDLVNAIERDMRGNNGR